MKVKTSVKAGGRELNHNEALVRVAAKGLKVTTGVKAGIQPQPLPPGGR
jgi:hypothetical protein